MSEHSLPALWNVIYLNLSKHSKAKLKCDATRDKLRVVTDDLSKVPKQRRARVRDSNSPTTAHIHICKRETVYTTTIHFTIEFDGGNSDGTQEDQPGCRNLGTFPCTSAPSNTTRKTQCIFAGYIRRDQQSLVIRLSICHSSRACHHCCNGDHSVSWQTHTHFEKAKTPYFCRLSDTYFIS